jgi:hypothetical protein
MKLHRLTRWNRPGGGSLSGSRKPISFNDSNSTDQEQLRLGEPIDQLDRNRVWRQHVRDRVERDQGLAAIVFADKNTKRQIQRRFGSGLHYWGVPPFA